MRSTEKLSRYVEAPPDGARLDRQYEAIERRLTPQRRL